MLDYDTKYAECAVNIYFLCTNNINSVLFLMFLNIYQLKVFQNLPHVSKKSLKREFNDKEIRSIFIFMMTW